MLEKGILKDEILKITDINFVGFEEFPISIDAAAERWANVLFEYAKEIVPPSATIVQAKDMARSQFALIGVNRKQFEIAITKFAEILKDGMIGFTGVMPTFILDMEHIFNKGFNGASSETIAEEISEYIDVWFKTGTAINISSGVTINWK